MSGSGSHRRSCRRGARKTPKIVEVLPLLYLHGLSSGDFVPALGQFLGSAQGLSAATITKLTQTWKAEARAFAERLGGALDVPVALYDERFTTALAQQREGSAAEDSRAAAVLLEDWLASRR